MADFKPVGELFLEAIQDWYKKPITYVQDYEEDDDSTGEAKGVVIDRA